MVLFKAKFENMGFLFLMTIFPIRWLVSTMIDDWCHVTGFLGGFFDINRFCEGMELWINQKDMDMSNYFSVIFPIYSVHLSY